MFLAPKVIEVDEAEYYIYETKNLDTIAMKAFMDAYNAWATSEMGIGLPIPEERMMR